MSKYFALFGFKEKCNNTCEIFFYATKNFHATIESYITF